VVHLGAVGGVVVDDDDEGEPQPNGRLQLRDPHQEPAVTRAEHRQAIGPGQSRADGRVQAPPDRLERLGEVEAELVRQPT